MSDVEKMLRTWQVQVTHPRYFGLFNPSVTLASVVADTLVAMYNSQLANWRTSPAANEIERHTLGWLAEKFGLPPNQIATFTSGGTEANLSAVVVALTRAFPDYGEHGVRRLSATPSIYLTAEAHNGYNKIAHMTGLDGERAIVSTDSDLKMNLDELQLCAAEDRNNGFLPSMAIGTAGTTATGVIDPLPEIGQFSREQGLWFHVDAAGGGSAILAPASSITWMVSVRRTPLPATRISGFRFRWGAGCSSAAILIRSRRLSAQMFPICPAKRWARRLTPTPTQHSGRGALLA